MKKSTNTNTNDLQVWLHANRLSQIMDVLEENEVETLEDLKMLETEDEIQEFAEEIGLNKMLKNRFVQSVMKLNGIQQPNGHGIMNADAHSSSDDASTQPIEQKAAIKLQNIFQSILDNEDNMDKYVIDSEKIFAEFYECGSAMRMLKHAGFTLSDDEERIIWERNVKTIHLMGKVNDALQAKSDCDNPISAVLDTMNEQDNAHMVSICTMTFVFYLLFFHIHIACTYLGAVTAKPPKSKTTAGLYMYTLTMTPDIL